MVSAAQREALNAEALVLSGESEVNDCRAASSHASLPWSSRPSAAGALSRLPAGRSASGLIRAGPTVESGSISRRPGMAAKTCAGSRLTLAFGVSSTGSIWLFDEWRVPDTEMRPARPMHFSGQGGCPPRISASAPQIQGQCSHFEGSASKSARHFTKAFCDQNHMLTRCCAGLRALRRFSFLARQCARSSLA